MESASDLVPVFQYRNWPRPIANDQTQPDDDDNSIQIEHLAQSFDAATSIRQGWNDTSSLAGLHQSARSDDLHISQWKARIGTFQQHTHMAMETSIDPELVPSSLEQVNNEISTFLCDRYNSDEPWNALAAPRKSYVDTSAPATYNISLHIAPNPGTLSMYYTATSEVVTNEVFHSATSRMGGYRNAVLGTISVKSEYFEILRSRGLWPVDPQIEHNWSGEGQHVEFKKGETGRINKLLTVEKSLGSGSVGFVHKVKCRRISMARKTVHTKKHFTKDQAISEVVHMTRLKHSHIIRLIGTYVWTKEFCILMYPVANGNLEMFLEYLNRTPPEKNSFHQDLLHENSSDEPPFDITQATAMASSCLGFFSCLSSAIRYIHCSITKHMDIKPQNVLVQSRWHYRGGGRSEYNSKVYISDFGISRSYESIDAANTDSNTSFSRRYASPEVFRQLDRDLSTDIFSLGCVFLEIFAALDSFQVEQFQYAHSWVSPGLQETPDSGQASCKLQEELKNLLESNHTSDKSYQGNLDPLQELLKTRIPKYESTSFLSSSTVRIILKMLQFVPQERPTADDLVQEFGERACCNAGPDELEAVDGHSEDNAEHHPEGIMKERIFQQSDGAEPNQEQIEAAPFWNEYYVAGLNEDHHLSRTLDGGDLYQSINLSLLTSHMGGAWY